MYLQTKPKGATTHIKVLDEYILKILSWAQFGEPALFSLESDENRVSTYYRRKFISLQVVFKYGQVNTLP